MRQIETMQPTCANTNMWLASASATAQRCANTTAEYNAGTTTRHNVGTTAIMSVERVRDTRAATPDELPRTSACRGPKGASAKRTYGEYTNPKSVLRKK